jgi:hypothetical protein
MKTLQNIYAKGIVGVSNPRMVVLACLPIRGCSYFLSARMNLHTYSLKKFPAQKSDSLQNVAFATGILLLVQAPFSWKETRKMNFTARPAS